MIFKFMPQDEKKIEEAIRFLADKTSAISNARQSSFFHAIRTGVYLQNAGYDEDIIIVGFLHGLSDHCDEIEVKFGQKIRELIEANSCNPDIKDDFARDKEMFRRCYSKGREALLVKSADILDESRSYGVIKAKSEWLYLLGKMKYFNNLSNELIRNEKPWQDVNQRYEELKFIFRD
jgi:(p)ppGpp synthase/HD superfamily hydrolase